MEHKSEVKSIPKLKTKQQIILEFWVVNSYISTLLPKNEYFWQ